jgi:FkbM family methyltransferase
VPRAREAAVREQNRRYDELTVAIMRRALASDSNCVDAGAHRGGLLQHMVALAPQGTHHAFEPLPDLAVQLADRFPTVIVHETALADFKGRASFRHVVQTPALSGFERRPWDSYDERDVEQIQVSVSRLDDVLPPDFRVDFMKIDVESSEAALLRGARRILRSCPFIAIEVGKRAEDVYGELIGAGLHVSRPDDWLAGRPPLSAEGFVADLGTSCFFLAHPS